MFSIDNPMLYSAYESARNSMSPVALAAMAVENLMATNRFPISRTRLGRTVAASCEIVNRMLKYYSKPDFNIKYCKTADGIVEIQEELILEKTFCNLLHFAKKPGRVKAEKLLLVAPLAGHYPTLLRGTVEGLLPHFDVYITEWKNARDIPLFEGPFNLSDYIDYILEFMEVFWKKCYCHGGLSANGSSNGCRNLYVST